MDGLDCFGADDLGFDYGALLQTAGGAVTASASMIEESQNKDKSEKAEYNKLTAAISADVTTANAAAQADVSEQLHSKSAQSDMSKAVAAAAASDQAGADLSSDQQQARLDAANKSLALAQKQAKAAPKDGYKAAIAKAWTAVVNKLQNPSMAAGGGKQGKEKDAEGWLTRRVMGPIPGYGVIVLALGLAGAGGIAIKKIFF